MTIIPTQKGGIMMYEYVEVNISMYKMWKNISTS